VADEVPASGNLLGRVENFRQASRMLRVPVRDSATRRGRGRWDGVSSAEAGLPPDRGTGVAAAVDRWGGGEVEGVPVQPGFAPSAALE
jgi:hypothetical protein